MSRKVKKQILYWIILLICLAALGVGAYALAKYSATKNPYIIAYAQEATPAPKETKTFLGQAQKWFEDNLPQVLSAVSVALSSVFLGAITPFLKKRMKRYSESIDNSTRITNEVVDVVNESITTHKEINEKVEVKLTEVEEKNAELQLAIDELTAVNKAILEIVTTVYANSKNLPQGYKDIISIKYAEALKSLHKEVIENGKQEQEENM